MPDPLLLTRHWRQNAAAARPPPHIISMLLLRLGGLAGLARPTSTTRGRAARALAGHRQGTAARARAGRVRWGREHPRSPWLGESDEGGSAGSVGSVRVNRLLPRGARGARRQRLARFERCGGPLSCRMTARRSVPPSFSPRCHTAPPPRRLSPFYIRDDDDDDGKARRARRELAEPPATASHWQGGDSSTRLERELEGLDDCEGRGRGPPSRDAVGVRDAGYG